MEEDVNWTGSEAEWAKVTVCKESFCHPNENPGMWSSLRLPWHSRTLITRQELAQDVSAIHLTGYKSVTSGQGNKIPGTETDAYIALAGRPSSKFTGHNKDKDVRNGLACG